MDFQFFRFIKMENKTIVKYYIGGWNNVINEKGTYEIILSSESIYE